MRATKLLAVTFAIILVLGLQAPAALPLLQEEAPPSYPLRVRGGGGLRLRTEGAIRRGVTIAKLIVEFEFGTRRARDGLNPGQGSWLDRRMRQGEPARLEYYVTEGEAQKIMDYLRSAGNYYTFECYNTRRGYLLATKAYP